MKKCRAESQEEKTGWRDESIQVRAFAALPRIWVWIPSIPMKAKNMSVMLALGRKIQGDPRTFLASHGSQIQTDRQTDRQTRTHARAHTHTHTHTHNGWRCMGPASEASAS